MRIRTFLRWAIWSGLMVVTLAGCNSLIEDRNPTGARVTTPDEPVVVQMAATETVTATPLPTPISTPTETPVPSPTPIRTGALNGLKYLDSFSIDGINAGGVRFYPPDNFLPALFNVDRFQVDFITNNGAGVYVPIRAEMYVPRVPDPVLMPVLVYGAGTTGIGANCAPLDEVRRNGNWGNYLAHMLSYTAQGYITILPQWQGYDAAETHPYFISDLEGYVMLDASRAVYNVFNANLLPNSMARPMDAFFFAGYSQGGHGAFAGDGLLADYAPEIPLKGTIGHALAPDVETLMRERPSLAPYIVFAYRDFYGPDIIDPAEVFLPQWVVNFAQDASTKCVDEVYRYYPSNPQSIYRPEFLATLYGGRLGEVYPKFNARLDGNQVGRATNPDVPGLLLHGEKDPIVTAKTAEAFLAQVCSLGKRVTYHLYPGVDHFRVRQSSFRDTLAWMQAVLSGLPDRNDCPTVGG